MIGSSPRGRGTPEEWGLGNEPTRFIPAWAGNTGKCGRRGRDTAVHPRVGGEHYAPTLGDRTWDGSSPRGRGTHGKGTNQDLRERFIPAWAGNTHSPEILRRQVSVHPRVGGEHHLQISFTVATPGSSPRGRGTHNPGSCPTINARFIPAWAGNTGNKVQARSGRAVHPRVGGEHRRHKAQEQS